jgi:probable phosphoglycerate mutase
MRPRLYLIRHGQTEWSLSGRHTGRTDLPLTPGGETESRALLPWLAQIKFSHVFTSPMRRARQTCGLAEGKSAPAAELEADLAEWDYGDYEGLRSAEIRLQQPAWNVFLDGCPAGETPAQIALRTDRLLARLGALSGNVALFSHGQFSCALAARWIGLPVAEGRHLALDTASLSLLDHPALHPELPVIALWNAKPSFLRDA